MSLIYYPCIVTTVLSLFCSLAGCTGDHVLKTMDLPPDYKHEKQQGLDTETGKIWKDQGLTISYDIGIMAGNFAGSQPEEQTIWRREQDSNGHKMYVTLTRDSVLYVTFPENSANFYAKIKSEADIDEFLSIISSYTPSEKIN